MECVRLWFEKKGTVKYVSHLDTMRCFQRAVRRAEIPLWYTEGFNPHPYLNFLSPLSLGIEGENEILDIRIEGNITFEEIKNRLNSVLPEGMVIKSVTSPFNKADKIAFAEYVISFEKNSDFLSKLNSAMESGNLVCEKTGKLKGKKVIKTVDVSKGIVKYNITQKENSVDLDIVFHCGNENNLNPMNLLSAFKNYFAQDIYPLNITRKCLLTEDFSVFD